MTAIKEYIISIIVASVLCSIIGQLLNKNTPTGKLARLLGGLVVTVTIIAPFTQLSFPDISKYLDIINADAHTFIQEGKENTQTQMSEIIKSESEAYILDKANMMNCNIDVEIVLNEIDLSPDSVVISGNISPYAKEVLSTYVEETLGIMKEKQIWN